MPNSNKKLPYKKPEFNFFPAKELDMIQAMMSGGSGGGGTIVETPVQPTLIKRHNSKYTYKNDILYDVTIFSGISMGLKYVEWSSNEKRLTYKFAFMVIANSEWGVTSPDINDNIISGLSLYAENVCPNSRYIVEGETDLFKGGSVPVGASGVGVMHTEVLEALISLALLEAPTLIQYAWSAFGLMKALRASRSSDFGCYKNISWKKNIKNGALYYMAPVHVSPGERVTFDVSGLVVSPYLSEYDSSPTRTVRVTINVPKNASTEVGAEEYISYVNLPDRSPGVILNSSSAKAISDINYDEIDYKIDICKKMQLFYEDVDSGLYDLDKASIYKKEIDRLEFLKKSSFE